MPTKTKKAPKRKMGQAKADAEQKAAANDEPARTTPEAIGESSKKAEKLLAKAKEMPIRQGVWKPEVEGDTLSGKIVDRKDQVKSKHKAQEPYTILMVQTDIGPLEFHCGSLDLMAFVTEEDPQPGQTLAAEFRGTRRTNNGYRVKKYAIAVE